MIFIIHDYQAGGIYIFDDLIKRWNRSFFRCVPDPSPLIFQPACQGDQNQEDQQGEQQQPCGSSPLGFGIKQSRDSKNQVDQEIESADLKMAGSQNDQTLVKMIPVRFQPIFLK